MLVAKRASAFVAAIVDRTISLLLVSSLFTAITGTLTLVLSFLLYGSPIDIRLTLAFFLIVFAVYSMNKVTDVSEDAINLAYRTRFVTRHEHMIKVAAFSGCAAALCFAFSQSVYAMLVICFPLVMGFSYSVGISGYRLKNIRGLKSFTVALSWGVVLTQLPLAVVSRGILEIALLFWFFFIKAIVNTTLFDLRDVDGDIDKGIMSLPAYLGRSRTRSFLLLLNASLVFWLAYSYVLGFFHRHLLLLALFIGYGYWYTNHFCTHSIGERAMDLALEGEWLLVLAAATPFVLR